MQFCPRHDKNPKEDCIPCLLYLKETQSIMIENLHRRLKYIESAYPSINMVSIEERIPLTVKCR